jgi:hypothetical protein
LLPLYVRNIEEDADEDGHQQYATCHDEAHAILPLQTNFRVLTPAKPGGGHPVLGTRPRRWQGCRLLHQGRRSLDMSGRRCGERIGNSRLRRGEKAGEKNCEEDGAEHGEILSGPIDGSSLAKLMCHPYETLQGLDARPLRRQYGGCRLDRSRLTEPCFANGPTGAGSGDGRRGLATRARS